MHDKDQCSINTNKTVPNWIVMGENSFFKKVISYLAELSKGKHSLLVDSGWLSLDEAHRVIVILSHLGFIEKNGEEYIVTSRGFNVLLYYKMGKMSDNYDESVLALLLNSDWSKGALIYGSGMSARNQNNQIKIEKTHFLGRVHGAEDANARALRDDNLSIILYYHRFW